MSWVAEPQRLHYENVKPIWGVHTVELHQSFALSQTDKEVILTERKIRAGLDYWIQWANALSSLRTLCLFPFLTGIQDNHQIFWHIFGELKQVHFDVFHHKKTHLSLINFSNHAISDVETYARDAATRLWLDRIETFPDLPLLAKASLASL